MGGCPLANKLQKVVKKGSKPKPIPVKIVYDDASKMNAIAGTRGIDKYDAQEAIRIMQRAAEIQKNKPLLKAMKTEAKAQIKTLSNVCK